LSITRALSLACSIAALWLCARSSSGGGAIQKDPNSRHVSTFIGEISPKSEI